MPLIRMDAICCIDVGITHLSLCVMRPIEGSYTVQAWTCMNILPPHPTCVSHPQFKATYRKHNVFYCRRCYIRAIDPSDRRKRDAYRHVNAKRVTKHDLYVLMSEALDAYRQMHEDVFASITNVFIENQQRSTRLIQFMGHILFGYMAERYPHVVFKNAQDKLRHASPAECATYDARKAAALGYAQTYIAEHPHAQAALGDEVLTPDHADTLLMCLHVIGYWR